MFDRKIIITQGIPGAGKSYWAKEYCRKNPQFKRVNRDDLRAMIDDSQWSKSREKFIKLIRDLVVRNAIKEGFDVILDETFLIPQAQGDIYEMIQQIALDLDILIDVEVKKFDTDLNECIRRDYEREGAAHVGEKVIRDYYEKYVNTKKTTE